MKAFRIFNVLLVLVMAASLFASVPAAKAQQPSAAPEFVPGEVVVGLSPTADFADYGAQASALADTVGAQVAKLDPSGAALLRFSTDGDVQSMVATLQAQAGVTFAEPNYIYRIPEPFVPTVQPQPRNYVVRQPKGSDQKFAVSIATLQSMKTRKGSKISATYPNDPYLWTSNAYNDVFAPIVWSNPTASKSICEIDTGVDNLHPDLAGKIVLGKDFVNEDLLPMDDNGHGTHVAGIMVALQNNAKGIGGIAANAKVVAVKALNAQGSGTNFDVSSAIRYCADRTDISIINMSLTGPYAKLLEQAVDYATNYTRNFSVPSGPGKGKLLVAAAGNDDVFSYCGPGTDVRTYPAGFTESADAYDLDPNSVNYCTETGASLHPAYEGVIAVASSGDGYDVDYNPNAKSWFSNYGHWVNFIAPGFNVYSTLPYDKPFDLFYSGEVPSRYGYLSGTSMAAPAASATFARGWGYYLSVLPGEATATDLNLQIKSFVSDRSLWLGYDFTGWPAEQPDQTPKADVAMVLERGGVYGFAVDATTGNAIPSTTLQVYQGTSLKASAVAGKEVGPVEPTSELYSVPAAWAEIINLPAPDYPSVYTPKVSITNYTAVPAAAFVNGDHASGDMDVWAGYWNFAGYAAVPPKSPNFSAVSTWDMGRTGRVSDLDQITFLPPLPKNPNDGQSANFEVYNYFTGAEGRIGFLDPATNPPDGTGSLGVFPFSRHIRVSETTSNPWAKTSEATVLRNRYASLGASFPANAALPYYTGTYEFWLSDWGQFFDDVVANGIEGPGELPGLSDFSADDYGPHLSMFIWKDGLIKQRVTRGQGGDTCVAGDHAWRAVTMTSNATTLSPFTVVDECLPFSAVPYGDIDLFIHTPVP